MIMSEIKEIDAAYEVFPFLNHFPFDKYIIFYTKEDQNVSSNMINSGIRNYVVPEFINFSYIDKYTNITVSFYIDDIEFIFDSVNKITKFDSVRIQVDKAIESDNMEDKLIAIKAGEKLIKVIDPRIGAGPIFNKLLENVLSSTNTKIPQNILKKIKAKSKIILDTEFEPKSRDIINTFFNMHLNYIKILIGIIIAAKLY